MKRPSDQLLAKRMLETRDRGFSFAVFLRSNAKRYLLLCAVIVLAIATFAGMNLWAVCYVFLGLLPGALLRDIERLAAGQDV